MEIRNHPLFQPIIDALKIYNNIVTHNQTTITESFLINNFEGPKYSTDNSELDFMMRNALSSVHVQCEDMLIFNRRFLAKVSELKKSFKSETDEMLLQITKNYYTKFQQCLKRKLGSDLDTIEMEQSIKRLKKDVNKNVLKGWIYEHSEDPYPNDTELKTLKAITNLDEKQLKTWFTNARMRLLGKIKEAKKLEESNKKLEAVKCRESKLSEDLASSLHSIKCGGTDFWFSEMADGTLVAKLQDRNQILSSTGFDTINTLIVDMIEEDEKKGNISVKVIECQNDPFLNNGDDDVVEK